MTSTAATEPFTDERLRKIADFGAIALSDEPEEDVQAMAAELLAARARVADLLAAPARVAKLTTPEELRTLPTGSFIVAAGLVHRRQQLPNKSVWRELERGRRRTHTQVTRLGEVTVLWTPKAVPSA